MGGLLESPRQAQVEVHRRREVRLKVLVGWGARLDRHCCTSSPESPCAQGGPSCAPTMEAFWSAECPERYRLTAVRPGGWLTSGAFECDGVWEAVEGKGEGEDYAEFLGYNCYQRHGATDLESPGTDPCVYVL